MPEPAPRDVEITLALLRDRLAALGDDRVRLATKAARAAQAVEENDETQKGIQRTIADLERKYAGVTTETTQTAPTDGPAPSPTMTVFVASGPDGLLSLEDGIDAVFAKAVQPLSPKVLEAELAVISSSIRGGPDAVKKYLIQNSLVRRGPDRGWAKTGRYRAARWHLRQWLTAHNFPIDEHDDHDADDGGEGSSASEAA